MNVFFVKMCQNPTAGGKRISFFLHMNVFFVEMCQNPARQCKEIGAAASSHSFKELEPCMVLGKASESQCHAASGASAKGRPSW